MLFFQGPQGNNGVLGKQGSVGLTVSFFCQFCRSILIIRLILDYTAGLLELSTSFHNNDTN